MPKKNPAQISLFPETLYEYHILLSPGDAIIAGVDELKQQLHELIGLAPHNLNSLAHLTLHKFEAYESVNVKDTLKAALSGQKSFIVKLAGHSFFESGTERTLFLKVENPEPVDALAEIIKSPNKAPKKINRQISILDKPKRVTARKTINPHVTIARNITVADFERITDFTLFDYENEWLCDRVMVRRRIAGSDKGFSPYATIKLG